jgi:Fic family protein
MRRLLDDARAWIDYDTWPPEEIALRFHHRLEWIHPFPNGNGRFGRITADYFVAVVGAPPFSWGANAGLDTTDLRAKYLGALRRMDRDSNDITALLDFARS